MAFGGGIFAKWLGYEDEALINGISVLIKPTLDTSLSPSSMWGYREVILSVQQSCIWLFSNKPKAHLVIA